MSTITIRYGMVWGWRLKNIEVSKLCTSRPFCSTDSKLKPLRSKPSQAYAYTKQRP